MLERTFDPETGILSVLATGALTPPEVDENCAEVRRIVAELRQEGRPVRVMYDVTALPPQGEELESYILGKIVATFRDDDRCALLTGDLKAKRHFRDLVRSPQIAVAASRLPAEMWLLYDDERAH